MAVITQIELANYLGEGFKVDGRRDTEAWNPLYRAVTLPLRGQSAAIQIENGDGKSSISEGCIYLLSHDRRLKDKVFSRCAPTDNGWSHIRIEFGIKDSGDNILQQDLITESPDEFPGITYVVGMCTNRDTKEANFYIYNGTLNDAPVYRHTEKGLELIDNETFKKSVERIGGSKWNKWSRKADWEEDIKQFVDTEVIRQNVEFQITGAGDASAMLHNIKQEAGESFDAAFFRHLIAPELLKNPMGNESDKDEHHFEDSLVKTLQGVSSAMVEIAVKEAEYKHASEALTKFEPVIEKAEHVIKTDSEYKSELATIVDDAAIMHAIVVADPVPGIPQINKDASWISNKRIVEVVSHLVIDKREGVLITDDGIAKLIGIDVGRVNQYGSEKKISATVCDTQAIDLEDVLKHFSIEYVKNDDIEKSSQPIDNKDVFKRSGRGGRRSSVRGYTLNAAKELIAATKNLHGASTASLDDILNKAFGIVMTEIDTNTYRHERNRLNNDLTNTNAELAKAEATENECQREIESLDLQVIEAEANQVAYSDFVRRKSEFPEHLRESPISAFEWSKNAAKLAQDTLLGHEKKVGILTTGYESWKALTQQHGKIPLESALSELNLNHKELSITKQNASKDLKDVRDQTSKLSKNHITEDKKLQDLKIKQSKLDEMKVQLPIFYEIFGDVDPSALNPQAALSNANSRKLELFTQKSEADNLHKHFMRLKPSVGLFKSIFKDADPISFNPLIELADLQQQIYIEENVLAEYQPLVEALSYFEDRNPAKTPTEWLVDTAKHRQVLNTEKIDNNNKITNFKGELHDLDAFLVADDRVYSQALKMLDVAGIKYERLHEVISAIATGDRHKHLLSLFSAALSAPVVTSINDAESTTSILEKGHATVPVFLKEQLIKFAKDGEFESTGNLTFNFLVGRCTRQVDILLDPNLINEEKARIIKDIQELESRNQTIENQLLKISEESNEVQSVLMAKEAISKGSVDKHATASKALDALQLTLPTFKKRASADALSAIESMKQFNSLGGQDKLTQLTEKVVPELISAIAAVIAEIISLDKQTTDEANKSRAAVKAFMAIGGEAEFSRISNEINVLGPQVKALFDKIEAATDKIDKLEKLSELANAKVSTFEQSYFTIAKELKAAITFMAEGHANFMHTSEQTRLDAINEVEKATNRLSGIDFEKAERYLKSVKAGDRDITKHIANAKAAKVTANGAVKELGKTVQRLESDIANITPFVEALHEMVASARDQYVKFATLGDDVRQRYLTTKTINHEVSKYADEVRIAILGSKPGTSTENKAAIYNLKESISVLKIDTNQLLRLNNARKTASSEFEKSRNEFCAKARNNEIKGLSHLEIEDIAKARTIDELNHIQDLKGRIDLQIKEKEADLHKSKVLAEESKNASIENMSRFARQAEANLKLMDRVMQQTPSGRFYIDVQIADHERVTKVVESLLNDIQDRERLSRERSTVMLNDDISKRKEMYRDLVKRSIYKNLFIDPVVEFSHTGIWDGARKPMNNEMSKGQITALHLMWMIKQAEYSLRLVTLRYNTKRERDAALKNSQRILFFDGLFSNLSNDNIIDDAFQGLKFVGENFQLIGLLHHPRYVNNAEIFPIHLVGKRFKSASDSKKRGFMAVQPWQKGGDMAMFASFFKRKVEESHV